MKKLHYFVIIFFLTFFLNCGGYDSAIVKYTVSGISTNVRIEYMFGDDLITLDNEDLPWEYKYKLWSSSSDGTVEEYTAYLYAKKLDAGDTSTVELAISVDGEIMEEASFSDEYGSRGISSLVYLEAY